MIRIKQSKVADNRTCDWSKVSKEQLIEASKQHISDVSKGLYLMAYILQDKISRHDWTRIECIDEFYSAFRSDLKNSKWYKEHQICERHHFHTPEYIDDDVNLLDVIEHIVDGVMAGLARSGKYKKEPFPNDLLVRAFDNTVDLLVSCVEVEAENPGDETK